MPIQDFATKAILVGTVLVTNLIAGGLGSYWLYESRAQYEHRAEAMTQNLTFGLDQSVSNIIDKVDLILRSSVEEVTSRAENGLVSGRDLPHAIEMHTAHLPELAVLAITDDTGHVTYSTGSALIGADDLHEQSFFTALRDHGERGLYMSPPLDTVIAQKKVLVFARRIDRQNGSMAGMVFAALPLDYFFQMMARYVPGGHETLAIRDLENTVLVRYPVMTAGTPGAIGSNESSVETRQAILSGQQEGTYHTNSSFDGRSRTVTVRRLDLAPVYVVASTPKDDYLSEWRGEVRKTIAFLIVLLAGSALSGTYVNHLFKIAGRESRRNRMFLERAADGVHVLDSRGKLVEASDSFCAMLGYSRAELIGSHVATWEAHWSKDELDGDLLPRLVAATQSQTFETIHRRKDGSLIAVEVNAAPVVTRRERYIYASSRDITERNRLKSEIDAALQRFEAIFQNNPVPLGMMDYGTGVFLDVNPAWEEVTGLNRDQVIGRLSSEIGIWVDPGERSRFFDGMGPDGLVGPKEAHFRRADGVEVTYSVKGRLIPLGSRRLFIWASEDITERKRVEVGLRLAASVFDFSHDGIMVTDRDNKIVEINPAFTRITGYLREDVLGHDPKFLGAGDETDGFYAEIWDTLSQTNGWRGEVWNKRKSGEVYPALLSIAAIHDAQQTVQRYIGVFSDISQIKEHEAELHRVAHFDALTGLPNRRLLADRMHQAIARARRHDSMLAICFVDLDGFKEVNDQLGHEVGDRLLIAVSTQIQEVLRGDDTLARLGGDEFVILLNDTGTDKKCFQVLDRVLLAIIAAAKATSPGISVSGSIGVTLFPSDDADADTLLRHADQAMYRAKESGKGRYHKFDPDHDRQVRASHEALQRLSIALEREEFVLYYQPKVNMVTGAVIGTEALVRWLHPERGVVAPASFLPTIEGHDLEIALGDYVFDAALTQMARWKIRGLNLPVSVNVSPNHLQIPNFALRLKAILARHPMVSAGDLQLEIIESTAISDIKRATATLEACREMGVQFALDDFGTGYSSLTYFRKLPIDILKIDQSFVRDMLSHPDDLGLVGSVVHLAQAFNRPVIAEGVETEQHGELLVTLGCHLGQGYGIARPMPADLLQDWIAHWQGDAGWRFTPLADPPESRPSIYSLKKVGPTE